MPLAVAGWILLGACPDRGRGWAVMLCALAVGLLLLAWFNRGWSGPGLAHRPA